MTCILSDSYIKVQGRWHVKYWFVSDIGKFEATVSRMSMSLSVTLGATQNGQLTVNTTKCVSRIARLDIHLRGGASWLYNVFQGQLEKQIRNTLQRKLCDHAENKINVDIARKLSNLLVVPLGHDKQWLLDYRLVSPPAFESGYLELFHKGEFFNRGNSTEAPFQPSPLPSPPISNSMVTIWISDYVFNTAGYVWQKRGMVSYNMTKNNLPKDLTGLLSTTCTIQDRCLGILIPQVGQKYPNSSIEVNVSTTEPPSVIIDAQDIIVRLVGSLAFRARLQDSSSADLFGVNVVLNVSVVPFIEQQVLKAKVSSTDKNVSMNLANSNVGTVPADILKLLLDAVKKTYVIPKMKEVSKRGMPLGQSEIKNFIFVKPQLQLENNCVRISTNAYYQE